MRLIIGIMLCLYSLTSQAYNMRVRYVYDGDTILVTEPSLPGKLSNMSVRISGVDTPELRGACLKERQLAQQAKLYLRSVIGDRKFIKLQAYKWDKYGGRIDATVVIGGVDISEGMIANGVAVRYNGAGVRKNWCN